MYFWKARFMQPCSWTFVHSGKICKIRVNERTSTSRPSEWNVSGGKIFM
jgi:hypothetical protein